MASISHRPQWVIYVNDALIDIMISERELPFEFTTGRNDTYTAMTTVNIYHDDVSKWRHFQNAVHHVRKTVARILKVDLFNNGTRLE